jgi:hypothetical protein
MTNKEKMERNIGLAFDFVNYLIDNPEMVDNLPEHSRLEFIEKDFPKIEKTQDDKSDSRLKKKYVRVRNNFEIAK